MAALLYPLTEAIGRHVGAGPVLYADDITVPVLEPGRGQTRTGRLWAVVRDERPFAGPAPPAVFYAIRPIAAASMRRAVRHLSRLPACRRLCRLQLPVCSAIR